MSIKNGGIKMSITIDDFNKFKILKKKITVLTAYDYMTAKIVDNAGIDAILIGDSLGMVFAGNGNTTKVTMDDMVYHTKAVSKAVNNAFVIADMPFLSYNTGINDAIKNAGRLVSEGGSQSVKLEGALYIDEIKGIISSGIPVMGHLGYTPQSVNVFGKNIVRGRDFDNAQKLIDESILLQNAGVFSIVLECVPYKLAKIITDMLHIPTISIGAGVQCDGQVLVINDLIGMSGEIRPKHAKVYNDVAAIIGESVKQYIDDVRELKFPTIKNSFSMDDEVINKIINKVNI
jgi:3-methyl-2-oxobutanoate hydroxymethyltransferase